MLWDFHLTMFITTSVIAFLSAILDKDIKNTFDMKIIVLGWDYSSRNGINNRINKIIVALDNILVGGRNYGNSI